MHHSGSASTQSGAGLLRLDTDLGSDQGQLSIYGIPTPISAQDGERKSSFSSAWSFVSPTAQLSQPSSTSSFASCPEPSTPEPHGISFEYSPYATSSPFERIDISSAAFHADPEHAGTLYTNDQQCTPASVMSFSSTPWTMVSRPAPEGVFELPNATVNALVPACGDLTTSMTPSLMSSPSPYGHAEARHSMSAPWDTTTLPYQSVYASQDHHAIGSEAHTLQESEDHWSVPMRYMLQSSVNAPTTIIPSEAMPPAYDYSAVDLPEDDAMDTKGYALPSPARSDAGYFRENQSTMESQFRNYKSEPYSPTMRAGAIFIPSGCKVTKHGKKVTGHRSGKARTRNMHKPSKQDYAPGVPITTHEAKKFPCRSVFDGKVCGKRFSRIEHLTRHEKTHNSDEVFYCPLSSCPKSKHVEDPKTNKQGLGRRDNWRDHLKTHLKPATSNAPRNTRCSVEVLFEALRKSEGDQEAERQMALVEQGLEKERLRNEIKAEAMRA